MIKILAELLGTFLLLSSIYRYGNEKPYFAAITIGLTLAVGILLAGPISGAHFNPAVTVGMFLDGKISGCESIQYVAVQLLAVLAALSVKNLVQ